ncbi:MAG: sterol desaturase family protein [Acidimicrobiaceae bacterium]|nr:sterol desaturase family protein [Acidimicrobiaceae bacterium]
MHRFHHRFVAAMPYVALALHPAELLMLQAATLAPMLIIPFYAVSVAGVVLYILVFNVAGHSGVRLVSALQWQPPSRFHDDHHAHVHVNFGQHLMLWDRLHGTLRRHGRRYGPEVFGGRGERDVGGTAGERELEPFIRF